MNTYRLGFASLVLALVGVAHASEITEFPLEKSTRSRDEVRAEARTTRAMPGELYDGSLLQPAAKASVRSRDEVRAEAIAATAMRSASLKRNEDLVGGM